MEDKKYIKELHNNNCYQWW